MNFHRQHWISALLFCLLCLSGAAAWAQSARGNLAGNITDPTGAVIPNVQITAVNPSSGVSVNTVSTSAGSYRFAEMPLGTYDVTFAAPGFSTQVQHGVNITVNSTTALSVVLQPGGASTTVSVTANPTGIQTESSDISGTVTSRQIVQLPLALGGVGAMRSPEAFVFLQPGTTGPGSGNSNNGIFINKIAGGQNFGNEVLLDGIDQQRSENGSSFDEEAPSVEALQEFKVTTALPGAQYGRTTGGLESFVTKSGTNDYHGTAYDIIRNGAMDANSWFANAYLAQCAPGDAACRSANARGPDRQNDFGGTLGGPVVIPHVFNGRDKTFFFFSWEQFRQTVGQPVTSTVPTAAMRTGDFSAWLQPNNVLGTNPCDGTPVYYGQIFDPATTRTVTLPNGGTAPCRTAFPGNIIPAGRITPVAANILNYWPLPQNSNLINNFTLNSPFPITNTTYTVRIDQAFSAKSHVFGSYSTRENSRLAGGPGSNGSTTLPGVVDPNQWAQDFITHFFRLGWDYSFSPTVLNHLAVGSNRSNSKNFTPAALGHTNFAQQLGIGNIQSFNFPVISVGESIDNLSNYHNGDNIDNGLRLVDSVAWEKGRNSFTFGVDSRYQQYSPINLPNPNFNFGRGQTAATTAATVGAGSGNGFASFLLGDVQSAGTQQYLHQPRWISWYHALFAEDDVKASNALTLNLGLRWDVDIPRHEALNDTSNFSPTAVDPQYNIPGAIVFGSNCHCNTKWANTYWHDFAPRVGFAYSPAQWQGKTVVRGGGAILYGPLQYSDFGGAMTTGYSVSPNPTSGDGFTPAFNITSGFPAYAPPPNLNPGIFNGTAVGGDYIEPSYGKVAAIYDWTLQVQQQVSADMVLTIGYVGNRGAHLHSGFLTNPNNMPKQYFALGNALTQTVPTNTVGVTPPFAGFESLWGPTGGDQVQRALRPFPQYTYIAGDCCLENLGHSSYDALLVSFERRFSHGLQFLASYTWSKDITDADSALPFTNNGSNAAVAQAQDPTNLKADKSVSMQDIPNTFVLSYLWDLPFGKGRPWMNRGGIANFFLGGWEVGAIQRYMSGSPVSFGCASGIPGWDNCVRFSFTGNPVQSQAARNHKLNPVAGLSTGSDPLVNSYFNGALTNTQYTPNPATAAFFDQNQPAFRGTGAYRFGNVPRVSGGVRLFMYPNEDFSLLKTFPIHESLSFTLKAEALNAFNRHTFTDVDTTPSDLDFGIPFGTINTPRQMQITGRITF